MAQDIYELFSGSDPRSTPVHQGWLMKEVTTHNRSMLCANSCFVFFFSFILFDFTRWSTDLRV